MKPLHRIGIGSLTAIALAIGGPAYADDDQQQHDQDDTAQQQTDDTTTSVTLYFDAESIDMNADSENDIDAIVSWLEGDENRNVVIMPGVDQRDAQLATARARALQTYLIERGIAPDRVAVIPPGQRMTDDAPPTANRRVIVYSTTYITPHADMSEHENMHDDMGNDSGADTTTAPPAQGEDTYAEGGPYDEQAPYSQDDDMADSDRPDHLFTPYGLTLAVGAGATGFTDSEMRDFTDTGVAWEARATFGTRRMLALEGAYIGSAQSIDALGLDDDAVLVGNGVEGNLRLNFLTVQLQPYVFGGVGWTRYDISNSDANTSSFEGEENVMYVPVGAGFGFRAGGFAVDVRGTWRAAFSDDIVRGTNTGLEDTPTVAMDSWTAGVKLGWEL